MSGKAAEVDAEFPMRLADELQRQGISEAELARRLEVSRTHVNGLVKGKTPPGRSFLRDLALVLGVRRAWLASGELPRYDKEISRLAPGESEILRAWRSLGARGRTLLGDLILWAAEEPSRQTPIIDLDDHRPEPVMRPFPLLGYAAARDDESVAFEAHDQGEDQPTREAPESLWREGRRVVEVRGESMSKCGIHTGTLLLVDQLAELGRYGVGDIVIAEVDGAGIVVKEYGGQGGSAAPPLEPGWIKLNSCSDGVEPIVMRKADDETPGIDVRFKVVACWPPRDGEKPCE